jgi:hypothetical protein
MWRWCRLQNEEWSLYGRRLGGVEVLFRILRKTQEVKTGNDERIALPIPQPWVNPVDPSRDARVSVIHP